jgi:hypothetical protein
VKFSVGDGAIRRLRKDKGPWRGQNAPTESREGAVRGACCPWTTTASVHDMDLQVILTKGFHTSATTLRVMELNAVPHALFSPRLLHHFPIFKATMPESPYSPWRPAKAAQQAASDVSLSNTSASRASRRNAQ